MVKTPDTDEVEISKATWANFISKNDSIVIDSFQVSNYFFGNINKQRDLLEFLENVEYVIKNGSNSIGRCL